MPVEYLRTLTAPERTRRTDVHLGLFLAFNAGAINAGGLLAVIQYTSHMTGLVAEVAGVTMRPENTVELSAEDAERMQKLLDVLEDLDDVQEVYHNAAL